MRKFFVGMPLLFSFVAHAIGDIGSFYRVRRIASLPGGDPGNYPTAINNLGQVTGRDFVFANYFDAYRWSPDTNELLNLGTLPGCADTGATPHGINDGGHVCGIDRGDPACAPEAFLWTAESGFIGIGALPGGVNFWSEAKSLNNHDQIVGQSVGPRNIEAFLWDPVAGMFGLGDLGGDPPSSVAWAVNDSTWIVGTASSPRGHEAFLWRHGQGMIGLGDFHSDGLADSDALAINQLGVVAGVAAHPEIGSQSFLWTQDDGMVSIGVLDPNAQYQANAALDINDRDEVLGVTVWGTMGDLRPYIWDRVRGMRDVSTLIDPCERPQRPFRFSYPVALNNSGQIILEMGADRYGVLLTPYLRGDFDENFVVEIDDLMQLLSRFGTPLAATYADGDLDCDGDVDLQDLAILLSNFGESYP